MGKIHVTVVSEITHKKINLEVPVTTKCGIIKERLADLLGVASTAPGEASAPCCLVNDATGETIDDNLTLLEAGIGDGSCLCLRQIVEKDPEENIPEHDPADSAAKKEEPLAQETPPAEDSATVNAATDSVVAGASAATKTPKERDAIKIFSIIGMLSGATSVILGIVVLCSDYTSWSPSYYYGGDAYTGIQHAAAETANNIGGLEETVSLAAGSLLLVLGIAIFCFFGIKLSANKK